MAHPIVETVRQLAEDVVAPLDIELVDVEYVKEHKDWILRVFIDKAEGISLQDCQTVSDRLGAILDEVDPVPGPYALEVSSPGIERPLKKPADYERFVGRDVQIQLYASLCGRKKWFGRLLGLVDEQVQVEVEGKIVIIPYAHIAKARLRANI